MKNHLADKTILPIVEPNPAIKIVKDELREAIYLINGAEAALSEEIGFWEVIGSGLQHLEIDEQIPRRRLLLLLVAASASPLSFPAPLPAPTHRRLHRRGSCRIFWLGSAADRMQANGVEDGYMEETIRLLAAIRLMVDAGNFGSYTCRFRPHVLCDGFTSNNFELHLHPNQSKWWSCVSTYNNHVYFE